LLAGGRLCGARRVLQQMSVLAQSLESGPPVRRKRIGAFGMVVPVKRRPRPADEAPDCPTPASVTTEATGEVELEGDAGAVQLWNEEHTDAPEAAIEEEAGAENGDEAEFENEENADDAGWQEDWEAENIEAEISASETNAAEAEAQTEVQAEVDTVKAEIAKALLDQDMAAEGAAPGSPSSSSSSSSSSSDHSPVKEIDDDSSLLDLASAKLTTQRISDESSLLDLAGAALRMKKPLKATKSIAPAELERKAVPLPQTPPGQSTRKTKKAKVGSSKQKQAPYKPLHRKLPPPEWSIIYDSTSWDRGQCWESPLAFKKSSELVDSVEIVNHRQEDLWFSHVGVQVSCDWCESTCLQSCGRLQGAPGRSAFSQCEFVCHECIDQWGDDE